MKGTEVVNVFPPTWHGHHYIPYHQSNVDIVAILFLCSGIQGSHTFFS